MGMIMIMTLRKKRMASMIRKAYDIELCERDIKEEEIRGSEEIIEYR